MKVTEFAQKVGSTPDTVRHYVRVSLLRPKKDANGYKHFSEQDVVRMTFILNARRLGFSVADIIAILNEADQGKPACPMVRDIIQSRLQETEQQFEDMQRLRTRMNQAVQQWQGMADKAPTSEMICHLVECFDPDKDEGEQL